ncbi:MAG: DUF853 family protein [Lachnospiraceae bacterium]|nr:DUF853 family protein [Lachnospiraceae bacterium]
MYLKEQNLAFIAKGDNPVYLVPKMANRHGMIAGATGTGKTVTLKVLAEAFSEMGTPVFLADIKGDVTGMIKPGDIDGISKRLDKLSVTDFECKSFPVRFWDVFGEKGHNVRTTISEMGPDLIARLLELTEVQAGVLTIVFKVADDNGWLLIDLKDLKAMVKYVSENAKDIREEYGNVSPQSVGAIQRSLLRLEEAGGDIFFGEPDLDIHDWLTVNEQGKGYINILECVKLVQSPLLYSTFLLWMLSSIYETLPEAGDLDKPKMVFFFDEAHLLFDDAPKALIAKVEQVVRLIRSKGVGVYFISQKPADIPENVLAQLGNKIQHALRAYTPQEQKAVKVAAQSFRVNPNFKTEDVITELGTGEALVSFLDEEGIPTVVEKAYILPPQSSMSVADDMLVAQAIKSSPYDVKYATSVDRESAYEILTEAKKQADEEKQALEEIKAKEKEEKEREKALEAERKAQEKAAREREKEIKDVVRKMTGTGTSSRRKQSVLTKTVNTATNTIGREIGKQISRGILGSLKKMF